MGRKLAVWLCGLQILAFALLEGSMLTLGAMVAPALFKTVASRDVAGKTFGNILGIWLWFALGCAVIILICSVLDWRFSRSKNILLAVRSVAPALMLGLLVPFGFILNRMQELQYALPKPLDEYAITEGPRKDIDSLHKISTNLLQAVLFIGLAWFVLSAIAYYRAGSGKKQTAPAPASPAQQNKEFAGSGRN
jgi:uncharacterized BrkB/YihY/UPF0761 family membrane protein